MLEVHAPHEAIHTWKSFLVHIAAITLGLLLALALEKTVEYSHERRQLAEARRELAAELADNRLRLQKNLAEALRNKEELAVDLKIIQSLRSHEPPVGKFDYSEQSYAMLDGSWKAAQTNGSLSLMPHEELQSQDYFHNILNYVMEAKHAFESTIRIAGAIAASAPAESLNAHDLDELAGKTMEAQGRLENLRMFLGYEEHGLATLTRTPSAAEAR